MFIRFVPADRYVLVDPGSNPTERRRNKFRHEIGAWSTTTAVIAGGYATWFAGEIWILGVALLLGALEWWTSPAIVRTPPYMAWVHDLSGPETARAFVLLRAREHVRTQLRAVRRHPEEAALVFGSEAELDEIFEAINGYLYALRDQAR